LSVKERERESALGLRDTEKGGAREERGATEGSPDFGRSGGRGGGARSRGREETNRQRRDQKGERRQTGGDREGGEPDRRRPRGRGDRPAAT
jgi:hypothetical protein